MIATELGKAAEKPELRVVGAEKIGPESFNKLVAKDVRNGRISQLQTLRRGLRYMQIEVVYQGVLKGRPSLDDLSDDELFELRDAISEALDNYHTPDGNSFYEAGLLRIA